MDDIARIVLAVDSDPLLTCCAFWVDPFRGVLTEHAARASAATSVLPTVDLRCHGVTARLLWFGGACHIRGAATPQAHVLKNAALFAVQEVQRG